MYKRVHDLSNPHDTPTSDTTAATATARPDTVSRFLVGRCRRFLRTIVKKVTPLNPR
jgi:hypothetical protein